MPVQDGKFKFHAFLRIYKNLFTQHQHSIITAVDLNGADQYQLLKCENCGNPLGYIYIKLRKGYLSPVYLSPRYWPLAVQGSQDFEETAFCETCFQKRVEEISKGKQETTINKDEGQEPRTKSKDRSLIR